MNTKIILPPGKEAAELESRRTPSPKLAERLRVAHGELLAAYYNGDEVEQERLTKEIELLRQRIADSS